MPLAVPLSAMRQPVEEGQTRSLAWRCEQLGRLERLLDQLQQQAPTALAADLGKPELEASFELLAVRGELKHARRHLRRWMAPQRRPVDLGLLPASAWVQAEPLGCVLIIGPWNYPLQLCLRPLVAALAAGNTAVIKPSELAPHSATLLAEAVADQFEPEVVQVVLGDASTEALAAPLIPFTPRQLQGHPSAFGIEVVDLELQLGTLAAPPRSDQPSCASWTRQTPPS
jgi:aldehyde dehydrogenase (NAD+)